jgi:hypothetical protein
VPTPESPCAFFAPISPAPLASFTSIAVLPVASALLRGMAPHARNIDNQLERKLSPPETGVRDGLPFAAIGPDAIESFPSAGTVDFCPGPTCPGPAPATARPPAPISAPTSMPTATVMRCQGAENVPK